MRPTEFLSSRLCCKPSSSSRRNSLLADFIKPFRIGTTGRLGAHALLYAPSPQELLGPTYGLTAHNNKGPTCDMRGRTVYTNCHGEVKQPFRNP